jgi:nucleoid DNA-binding protein
MANVTKKDLIDGIAVRTGEKRSTVKVVVEDLIETVMRELSKGNRIELRDFGIFETKVRAPRLAQNPKTLVKVEVPAKATVKFKAGRKLKRRVDDAVGPDATDTTSKLDNPPPDKKEMPDVTVMRPKDSSIVEPKSSTEQSNTPKK